MRFTTREQVADFDNAVAAAKGEVHLCEVQNGEYVADYMLKSDPDFYAGIAKLTAINGDGDNLELFCDVQSDEHYFLEFLHRHPEVLASSHDIQESACA